MDDDRKPRPVHEWWRELLWKIQFGGVPLWLMIGGAALIVIDLMARSETREQYGISTGKQDPVLILIGVGMIGAGAIWKMMRGDHR